MATYTTLLQQDEKLAVSDPNAQDTSDKSPGHYWRFLQKSLRCSIIPPLLLWLLQLAILLSSATMLHIATSRWHQANKSCLSQTSAWSPGLEAVEYESLMFRGSLFHVSDWKGEPRPELDALWHRAGQVSVMQISEDEVRQLGKDPEYVVKWPEESGGGHVASVEVFHHLHCLNFLRKYTYRDYYNDIDVSFTESEPKIRRHLDHCIDLLRQAIMCTGDMGLMTYNWVLDDPDIYPDFDTRHRCRNFDKLLEWGETTMINDSPAGGFDYNNRLGVKFLDGDE